ncbi:MAG: helix-turn-helix domain-containing protein [Clostridiales bacterium]|nr:helix-turn-helix domain-containing protein [Clostridiales bacterium]
MAARVTDRQKKKIIADYLETESYRAAAKKNGVCDATVKRIVMACSDFKQKDEEKKRQNLEDMMSYMDSKRTQVFDIISLGLETLMSKDKLQSATPSQITTMIGTLIDKWTMDGNGDKQITVTFDNVPEAWSK